MAGYPRAAQILAIYLLCSVAVASKARNPQEPQPNETQASRIWAFLPKAVRLQGLSLLRGTKAAVLVEERVSAASAAASAPPSAAASAAAARVTHWAARQKHSALAAAHPALARLLALWRQLRASAAEQAARGWASLPEEQQARVQGALAAVGGWWSRQRGGIRRAAGAVVDRASEVGDALWAALPLTGHVGTGPLLSLSVAVKDNVAYAAREFWATIGPGGRWHPASFIEHKGHIVLEVLLVLVISALLLQHSSKPGSRKGDLLTEKEVDDLCAEWEPEPLAKPVSAARAAYASPLISSPIGPYVVADGRRALNLASFNFIGAANDPKIMAECKATIAQYGVGSCGPRGFYGTIDVHLQLEERLARHMGSQESIIYSYDLATIPSILPAFANSRDLIVCDEHVNFGIQNGCNLSRARILRFRHNDVTDLQRILEGVAAEDRRSKKPLNRRYIVVEGIYANTGMLAPLDAIVPLKHKYKYRLVVDESLAMGVLGVRGRGACEHFGLSEKDVEIRSSSLGNTLASVGGFCAGNREMVDHQRLSGLGYCFSASLPPYLATAAIGALNILESQAPVLLPAVAANSRLMRRLLASITGMRLLGGPADELSPVMHLCLATSADVDAAEATLQAIVGVALKEHSVLVSVHRLSLLDRCREKLAPSIRVAVSAVHDAGDLQMAAASLKAAVKQVLDR